MKTPFTPNGISTLVGSIPLTNHKEATELVLKYMADFPIWVQLPAFKEEGMVPQFAPGLPGLKNEKGKIFIDTKDENFDQEILSFYEEYMAVTEGVIPLEESRFVMSKNVANGLFTLVDMLTEKGEAFCALKGQVTGPFTLMTGTVDENDRAIFYNDQLRDAASKLLSLKAKWQARYLAKFGKPVIIFLDEPALAGFGTSAFISVTRNDVMNCFQESFDALHDEGALVGIHVCANTDWSLILDSDADIVNFDAYGYFDKFLLYADDIKKFINKGGILAWGVAPTLSAIELMKETEESLYQKWEKDAGELVKLGIDKKTLLAQSFFTPSCGTGSLSIENAEKAIMLTKRISNRARSEFLK